MINMIVPYMKNVLTIPKYLFIRIKYGKTQSWRKLETQQINNMLKNLNIHNILIYKQTKNTFYQNSIFACKPTKF